MTHAELVSKNYSIDMHLKTAFEYELRNLLEVMEIPEGKEAQKMIKDYFISRIQEIKNAYNGK